MTPQTVAHQAPLSIGFSRQEFWSGLPFPSPEDLPDPGIEPRSPALQTDSLLSELEGNKFISNWRIIALQCCLGFCHITTWISQKYAYSPSLFSHQLPPPSYPSRSSQSTGLSSLCYRFPLVIYFTLGNVCVSVYSSQIFPLSPSFTVSLSLKNRPL